MSNEYAPCFAARSQIFTNFGYFLLKPRKIFIIAQPDTLKGREFYVEFISGNFIIVTLLFPG